MTNKTPEELDERRVIVEKIAMQLLQTAHLAVGSATGERPGPQHAGMLIEAFFKVVVDMITEGTDPNMLTAESFAAAGRLFWALVTDRVEYLKRLRASLNKAIVTGGAEPISGDHPVKRRPIWDQ